MQAYGRMIEGIMQPEYAAYFNYKPARIFNGVAKDGMRNGEFSILGIGATIDLGSMQVYATTESLTNLLKPSDAGLIDARVGRNFVVGNRKRKPQQIEEDQTPPPPPPVMADEIEEEEEVKEPEKTKVEEPAAEPVIEQSFEPVAKSGPAPTVLMSILVEKTAKTPENESIVVVQGNHKDELPLGHYVVVGAFLSEKNVRQYSEQMRAKDYENKYGFLTEKDYYYVYIYKNVGDVDKARHIRNKFRTNDEFEFSNAWLLSVIEEKGISKK